MRVRSRATPSSSPCATASGSTARASGSSSRRFEAGRTEAEILAPCERYFVEQGCGRLTMDMVLVGESGAAHAGVPHREHVTPHRAGRPGAAVARGRGPGRPLGRGVAGDQGRGEPERGDARGWRRPTRSTPAAAPAALKAGATAHDVHRAVAKGVRRPRLHARPRDGPLDRDDDDRVPEDRRGRRDRARGEHGALGAPARRSRRTAARASTCRRRGSSRRTAACRSPASPCGSTTPRSLGREGQELAGEAVAAPATSELRWRKSSMRAA